MKRIDERTELKSDFNLVSTREQDHPAWRHFRRAMHDKQYGRGPLNWRLHSLRMMTATARINAMHMIKAPGHIDTDLGNLRAERQVTAEDIADDIRALLQTEAKKT